MGIVEPLDGLYLGHILSQVDNMLLHMTKKSWVEPCIYKVYSFWYSKVHYMAKKIRQKEQAWDKVCINYKLKHKKLNTFMNSSYLISNSCLENRKVGMNLLGFCFLFVYVSSLFIWLVAWSEWKLNMVGFLFLFFNICRFVIWILLLLDALTFQTTIA